MRIFLSHISEKAVEARALKKVLEQALSGLEVFVSAADIHLGEIWLKEIEDALALARKGGALPAREEFGRDP